MIYACNGSFCWNAIPMFEAIVWVISSRHAGNIKRKQLADQYPKKRGCIWLNIAPIGFKSMVKRLNHMIIDYMEIHPRFCWFKPQSCRFMFQLSMILLHYLHEISNFLP